MGEARRRSTRRRAPRRIPPFLDKPLGSSISRASAHELTDAPDVRATGEASYSLSGAKITSGWERPSRTRAPQIPIHAPEESDPIGHSCFARGRIPTIRSRSSPPVRSVGSNRRQNMCDPRSRPWERSSPAARAACSYGLIGRREGPPLAHSPIPHQIQGLSRRRALCGAPRRIQS